MKKNEQMRHSGRKRVELNFSWPDPPMNIVLVEQEKQVTIGVAFELVTRSARQT
jgi:hypothetical protein